MFDRNDFPQLKSSSLIYFDSAATALKPQCVIDTMAQFYSHHYGTVHRAIYALSAESTARYSAVRGQVQNFLNAASSDEIIFTKGTTEAINLVAFSFGEAFVQEGDEILISGQEHHSNIVPWQLLCERKKAHLKTIPLLENGELDLVAYQKLLSERTKLVSIVHVSNVLGIVNPIPSIVSEAHRVGAKVFVDGAQSAPHLPIDVQHLGCDFFAFSGHKIYGPTGVGVLYGKRELLEQMPPYQGGGDMIKKVTFEKTTFQSPPLRFEAGTPMIVEVIGLGSALDYLKVHRNPEHEEQLLTAAIQKLTQIEGLKILGPLENRTSLLTFVLEGLHSMDVATLLDLKGIAVRSGHLCAQPLLRHFGIETALRISFSPYNTKEEIVSFAKALSEIKTSLARHAGKA